MRERTRVVGGIVTAVLAALVGVGSVGLGLLGGPLGVVIPLATLGFVLAACCAYLLWS